MLKKSENVQFMGGKQRQNHVKENTFELGQKKKGRYKHDEKVREMRWVGGTVLARLGSGGGERPVGGLDWIGPNKKGEIVREKTISFNGRGAGPKEDKEKKSGGGEIWLHNEKRGTVPAGESCIGNKKKDQFHCARKGRRWGDISIGEEKSRKTPRTGRVKVEGKKCGVMLRTTEKFKKKVAAVGCMRM